MLCRSCGTQIAEKAIVCYRCGTPTEITAPSAQARPAPRPRWPGVLSAGVITVLGAVVAVTSEPNDARQWIAAGVSLVGALLVMVRLRRR